MSRRIRETVELAEIAGLVGQSPQRMDGACHKGHFSNLDTGRLSGGGCRVWWGMEMSVGRVGVRMPVEPPVDAGAIDIVKRVVIQLTLLDVDPR